MKSKTRLLWMKLHAHFSCFFLPITLLYISTGMLYFFGFDGDVSAKYEYSVPLESGWPTTAELAKPIVLKTLAGKDHMELPADYYFYQGTHDWFGHEQAVILSKTEDESIAKLEVKEHDLLQQLLIVHKGYGGDFFKLFSILFGFSLAFSVISGVVITLQLPQFKRYSLIAIVAGAGILFVGFL